MNLCLTSLIGAASQQSQILITEFYSSDLYSTASPKALRVSTPMLVGSPVVVPSCPRDTAVCVVDEMYCRPELFQFKCARLQGLKCLGFRV